jgi:hypothetical protein
MPTRQFESCVPTFTAVPTGSCKRLDRKQIEALRSEIMPRGGKTWTPDEEQKLIEMVDGGIARPVVAKTLSRTVAAIEGRLNVIKSWRILEVERRD